MFTFGCRVFLNVFVSPPPSAVIMAAQSSSTHSQLFPEDVNSSRHGSAPCGELNPRSHAPAYLSKITHRPLWPAMTPAFMHTRSHSSSVTDTPHHPLNSHHYSVLSVLPSYSGEAALDWREAERRESLQHFHWPRAALLPGLTDGLEAHVTQRSKSGRGFAH